jgi:NADP-dependent 3-hydroxy acid dehydrogenase YdfG
MSRSNAGARRGDLLKAHGHMKQLNEADGAVVVITGASAGIGAALVRILCARGYRLVLAARSSEPLSAVAARCGERAIAVPTDVTVRAEVERLCDAAVAAFGRIDVWINNAGRGISRPVLELQDHEVDEMILVNVKSALYGAQAVMPYFKSRGRGHVISVSSVLSRVPSAAHRAAYSAAKAALNVLMTNLRMDLQADYPGIHISLVVPGPVASESFQRNAGGGAASQPAPALLPLQSCDEVAAVIADVVREPRAEAYSSPLVERLAADYAAYPAAIESAIA